MRFVQHLIIEKYKRFEENMLNKMYFRGIWNFYQAYGLSMAVLDRQASQRESFLRQNAWRKFLAYRAKSSLIKLQNYIEKDKYVINECLRMLEIEVASNKRTGDLFEENIIAISQLEWSED